MGWKLTGNSSVDAEVDATSRALHITAYDTAGNVIMPRDRGIIIPGSTGGQLLTASDYKTGRLLRCSPAGTLRTSDDALLLYDSCEGAAVDTNKWIQTTTTMTIDQAATTGVRLNANATIGATTGAMHTSHRRFPLVYRSGLVARFKLRATAHFANSLIELGFGTPTSATAAAIADGAVWRKDGTGQWVPVVSVNGAEQLGTPISDATFTASVPATNYFIAEVQVFDDRVHFALYTQAGVLISAQDLDAWGTGTAHFAVTHLQGMYRQYNSAGTGTAVQVFMKQASVFAIDSLSQREWRAIQSGQQYNDLTSPTAYTQAAQWANSADPAAAVLSNTTPSYTTLGGKFIGPTPTPAGAVTDFALFAFTVPSPYQFYCTGITIHSLNRGVAIGTTATVLEWGVAFNASSGSLASAAPYAPMRKSLGLQSWPIAAAIDSAPTPAFLDKQFATPEVVQPGRTLIVILRVVQGTATASGFLRGNVAIDGWFE